MKNCIKGRLLLPVLIAGFSLFLAPCAQAQFQWSQRVASTIDPDDELSIGMALDTNGNCYVTGWFDGTNNFGGVTLTNDSGGGQDIFVAKYNSTGALQWAQRAGGSSANWDAGRGLGVDTNGNVYVAGGYYGPANFGSINLPASSSENFCLAKYNNAGTVQWVQQGVGGDDVYGTGLAVDGAGNSYALVFANNGDTIAFGSTDVNTPDDFDDNYDASTILVKYDNTGTFKWAQVMGGYGETYATKVAVDAVGNVYVRGGFNTTLTIGTSNLVVSAGSTENMFVAKFNNSGSLVWVEQPMGGDVDEGGVAVDQTGNVYVSGSFDTNLVFGSGITLTNAGNNNALFGDAFVAKYNSSGTIQWAQAAGGTNGGFYWDLSLDAQTNIYAGGFVGYNAAVAKYSPTGTLQWTYSASGPPASPAGSVAAKCAVDSTGNCFLAGWYQGTATFGTNTLQPQGYWNYFLTKLSPALAVATTSLPNGTIGVAYNQTLAASGGQTPYHWTNISGTLPTGLTLATNGVISGTPTTIVTNNFTVQVKDATNGIATQSLSLTIQAPAPLQITTTSLPNGTNGVAYNQTLAASGGQIPYTWTNISGALPPGLTLATNGLIYGTPINGGTFNFTVKVTDALSETATQALALTVFGPPSVTLQPTNSSITVTVGSNATFFVSATGSGPFSYQWQLNGTNLPNGIITTVAGNGTYGYSGDGGVATNAELKSAEGVAVDATGNLFIGDNMANCIRKVGTNGIITTVAGNGTNGYSGDGGAATNAELFLPWGVAVDATGNLFIADYLNNRIRKVGTNGIITTVAGNGYEAGGGGGYSGDGGAATNAELYVPSGVAVDASGNLFIADLENNRIRKVDTNGIITTFAGDGTYGFSGDGSAATNAELTQLYGVAADANGNLFISCDNENDRIRRVGTNGIITTVAGNGTNGYSGDGGAATNAELDYPFGVAVDINGNLFIPDDFNNRIRKVDTNGIITTVAGNGSPFYSGDGGAAINAGLSAQGVAVDATGNLFIADPDGSSIRKVVFNSSVLSPTLILNNVGYRNAGAYDVVVSNPYGSVTSSVVNVTVTLPPVILSAPQIAIGSTNFTFLLSGPSGSNYVLQVSTNLLNWNPVSTSTIPVSGSITLSNATSGYNRRFYRAMIP